jgi:hypothetical protein
MGRTRKIYNKKLGKKKFRKSKRQKKSRRKSRRHLRKKVSVGGKHTRGGHIWQQPVLGKSKKDVYHVLDDLVESYTNDDTIDAELKKLLPDSICNRLAEKIRSVTTDLLTDRPYRATVVSPVNSHRYRQYSDKTKKDKLADCKTLITDIRSYGREFIKCLIKPSDNLLHNFTYLVYGFETIYWDYSRVKWSGPLNTFEKWVWNKARIEYYRYIGEREQMHDKIRKTLNQIYKPNTETRHSGINSISDVIMSRLDEPLTPEEEEAALRLPSIQQVPAPEEEATQQSAIRSTTDLPRPVVLPQPKTKPKPTIDNSN